MTITPPMSTSSPARVHSQLPPDSAAMSTITEPGFMPSTTLAGMSLGALRPGTWAVVMTTSEPWIWAAMSSACFVFCASVSSRA